MESQRLDDLARRLGRGASRRAVLKGFVGGLGAAIVGTISRQAPSASATALPPCNADDTCTDPEAICTIEGVCDPNATCGRLVGCPDPNTTCAGGACVFNCGETDDICTTDQDCCDGLACTNGACAESDACFGPGDFCVNGDACCSGICANGVCADADACAPYNQACSFPEVAVAASLDGSNCCEGYCLEGICVPACIGEGGTCADDDECCTGLTCVEGVCDNPSGFCGVPGDSCEIPDHHCCPGLTCFEGQCDNPSGLCMDDEAYCDDTNFLCCKGLICGKDSFCHPEKHHGDHGGGKPDEPTTPQGGAAVTSLPNTGAGPGDDGPSWINAAALGGAATILGGALLRKKNEEASAEAEATE